MSNRLEAANMLERGLSEVQGQSNVPLAYQLVSSSVIADPTFAKGWFHVGSAEWNMGRGWAAVAAYRRALELDPEPEIKGQVLTNLGHVLYHLGENEEAREYTMQAIKHDSRLSFPVCNMSLIESVEGRLDESLAYALAAHDMDPKNATIETALSFAYMFKRKWAKGLKHFDAARFTYRLPHFHQYPYPKWQGETGKVLYIVSEQGIGDALSYSRFVEEACSLCEFVHIGAQPELARVLRAAFQHLPVNVMPLPCPFPPAHFWTTFMSLPVALNLTDEMIENSPNINVPNFSISGDWKDKNRFNIGVSWSGSQANDINHWRSFPITKLLELYRVPGIQLYSLQMDDKRQEVHTNGCATLIRDMSPYIRDVADTFAIVKELDLIITAESLLGHIGGHCNVETWIAYSYTGRSVHIGHDGIDGVPFYPRHRVIKQISHNDWDTVFAMIVARLERKVKRGNKLA